MVNEPATHKGKMWDLSRLTTGNMSLGVNAPGPNRNHDTGLDVSPAVRDYLGMSGMDVCDWKFVNVYEVPDGPWALYGDNNTVAHLRRQTRMTILSPKTSRISVRPTKG